MKRNWAKDPSILTKDRLKTILASNDVILPDGDQRKDVYVKLYLQHIQHVKPNIRNKDHSGKSEFSSDDDTKSPSKSAGKRKSIRKRKGINNSSALKNVDSLSDEELLKNLKRYDDEVGPVIDSTRDLYKRKLKWYVQESDVTANQEFSDQEGATDSTNRKEVANSSTPRRGRAKGRRSVSRNEIITPAVNNLANSAGQKDAANVPNTSHSSKSSQQGLESVEKQNLRETSLWYFIIVLVMILAIFTGALMQKIDRSIIA